MKKLLVIQGHGKHLAKLEQTYGDDVIFSTWEGTKSKFPNTVVSKEPLEKGKGNSNLQLLSTYAGALKAEEIGAEFVLKIRSDLLIPDYKKLIECLDVNTLYFFSRHNWQGGYPVDYIFGGPIKYIKHICSDLDANLDQFPEKRIELKVHELGVEYQYILPIMIDKQIPCTHLKTNVDLVDYCTNDPLFVY
tara:strand:+ start:518 stop:1090 length:573 start_codon:yes stop_codon:yes gene_type:complete